MVIAIIQARMGSTRLPRKVAATIAGQTMLARVIQRTRQIPAVDEVVVATSEMMVDQWVCDESRRYGVRPFMGPVDDVLGRYEGVAGLLDMKPTDLIVRITADCPLLDPEVSGLVLKLAVGGGRTRHGNPRVSYASNLRDWPDGLDTEVFTRGVLWDAYRLAETPDDREHVTPWMRRNARCQEVPHEPNLRHVKFSVDTEEDLEYVRELYAVLGPDFGWGEIRTADPGKICELCRQGYPHRREVQGMPTRWDLHAKKEGTGIYDPNPECTAWAICRRAGGFPRLSIGVQSGGAGLHYSPDAFQASP